MFGPRRPPDGPNDDLAIRLAPSRANAPRYAFSSADFTRSGVNGTRRRRTPVASYTALPMATLALKAGVWFRRARLVIVSPDSLGTACPLSGRNSTYRPVQISGTGSLELRFFGEAG
jgi:hypothetical protein